MRYVSGQAYRETDKQPSQYFSTVRTGAASEYHKHNAYQR